MYKHIRKYDLPSSFFCIFGIPQLFPDPYNSLIFVSDTSR
jgi:hypothetical protein